ncbi:hypothetical protein CNMCM5793_000896 [Aspergillus hiratsukae]|uniref:Survival protein SurE-like phosphatase/nucleotidase domain-containing protein n=1 Tax=Aspergillus hiratsukae TaxID=1194566 RepID=A0A8H6PAI6_9EURO|nr:hypothetical protein CNMCM5793_000896 [Aspergillus hiratsukae]
MHLLPLVLLPLTAQAINIVSSNDDGWAEINIRQFYKTLTAAGHSVVVSAPAENQSGTGSSDETPTTLTEPCEFNSCPSGSPAVGYNASDPRLNYVNSYPVTSMKYGISTAAPPFFNGAPPALAVSGPNVGANLGLAVYFSGTVGAAHYAAEAGIPAIAFSGSSGSPTAWNAPVPAYSQVYAQLATKITNQIVASGTPYLPDQVWLNVNFPEVSDECASADDFKFVLSRIFSGIFSDDDVETCGSKRLPTETTVVDTDGCYVSISVGWSDKTDAAADVQAIVLDKLSDLLKVRSTPHPRVCQPWRARPVINRLRQLGAAARRSTAKEQSVRPRRSGLQSRLLLTLPSGKTLSPSFEAPNGVAGYFGLPDSVAMWDLINHDAATKEIITAYIDHRKNNCHGDKSNKAVRNNVVSWSHDPNALPAMRQAAGLRDSYYKTLPTLHHTITENLHTL